MARHRNNAYSTSSEIRLGVKIERTRNAAKLAAAMIRCLSNPTYCPVHTKSGEE